MADEADSKSVVCEHVRVRVPLPAVLGRGERGLKFLEREVFKASFSVERSLNRKQRIAKNRQSGDWDKWREI